MTLDQLRIFVAVADRQHLTQAAAALRLTPSAVSASIHALEERYATHLFHRVGRRIELSDAGRQFLPAARATLAGAHTAELSLLEIGDMKRGSLAIAASQTIASYWLPPALIRFKLRYPAIDLQLAEDNTSGVAQSVLAGDAELGFIEGRIEEPALAVVTVATDRLVVIAAPSHPLCRRRSIALSHLAAADWILREPGSGTRAVFESMLRAVGLTPEQLRVAMHLPNNEAICAAVRAGSFLAVVSELVAAPHIEAGHLKIVRFALPTRPFALLRHKERYRTKASEAFESLLRIGA